MEEGKFENFLWEIDQEGSNKPHHDLEVWQRSVQFVRKIYEITEDFPDEEKFSLVQQMRRAATSISSNIAEGAARRSSKDFNNFLGIAQGSNAELETQLLISLELGYVSQETISELYSELNELSRMIIGLRKSLSE